MGKTTISWTARLSPQGEWIEGFTQNFWIGCQKKEYITSSQKIAIDPACLHYYAEGLMDHRFHRVQWGSARSRTSTANWQKPYHWNRKAQKLNMRLAVFCQSLSDLFDETVPEAWFIEAWSIIAATTNLEWLILTKRIELVEDWLYRRYKLLNLGQILPHVRIGTTIGHQVLYKERASYLASLHQLGWSTFYSCEPLTSNLVFDFEQYPVDWVIVGGESQQPKYPARPCHLEQLQFVVDQCLSAQIPVFVKQTGSNPYKEGKPIPLFDFKGEEIAAFLESLQIRQIPPSISLKEEARN